MTKDSLKVGDTYKTKIGAEYQQVTLVNKRNDTGPKGDVIVRTGAGNLIYRTPGQIKKA